MFIVPCIQDELSNRLPPSKEETVTGEALVRKVFHLTGMRKAVVAGCRVKMGSLARDSLYRITRNGKVIFDGEWVSYIVQTCNSFGITCTW